MSEFKDLLLSYLLNSLWQVPLLLLGGFLAARLVRRAGPAAEHRAWVGALLAQALLPALSLAPWEKIHLAWPWHGYAPAVKDATVSVQMGAGTGLGTLLLPSAAMSAVSILYGAIILYFAARFAWRCRRLAALAQSTQPLPLAPSGQRSSRLPSPGPVEIASSPHIFAPLTIGFIRKRVLLPTGMLSGLSQADIDTAIAHELAHVQRNDFLKNLVYESLSLPVSYHPAFWLARQRMTETREMVCDQMAASRSGSHHYAQSLLRLASLLLQGKPLGVPHAIGVFDADTLERRLMRLTETTRQIGRVRRCAAVAASVLLGIAAASTAISLRLDVAAAATDTQQAANSSRVTVPPGTMAHQLLTKVNPKYPPKAKKARIQGKVELAATIDQTGDVENLRVISGPSELQQSALDAVKQWKYKPFLVHGNPVEVETTVNVIYSLAK